MNKVIRNILIAIVAIGLSACHTGGGVKEIRYPTEIRGIGESPNYPLVAAGFNRAEMMIYAPSMVDISTAYNHVSPEAQIAATIFRFSKAGRAPNIEDQYLTEKAQLEKYYSGIEFIGEEEVELTKNGRIYSGKRVFYRYTGIFMHQQQSLYSELMLFSHEDKYIKLRSTAPISQKEVAKNKNIELMEVVNWAN